MILLFHSAKVDGKAIFEKAMFCIKEKNITRNFCGVPLTGIISKK